MLSIFFSPVLEEKKDRETSTFITINGPVVVYSWCLIKQPPVRVPFEVNILPLSACWLDN